YFDTFFDKIDKLVYHNLYVNLINFNHINNVNKHRKLLFIFKKNNQFYQIMISTILSLKKNLYELCFNSNETFELIYLFSNINAIKNNINKNDLIENIIKYVKDNGGRCIFSTENRNI